MKILLTGGPGGHFYPLIAVAEAIHDLVAEDHLVTPRLYFMSDKPYDPKALFDNQIEFRRITAGKLRRYFSLRTIPDAIKTVIGIVRAVWSVFWIFPDVIFSKGGYSSFPVLLAARLFRIPVVIHESDSRPGRVNRWSAKFAQKIAVSYPEAARFFPTEKTAVTGNPIRREIVTPIAAGAHEFLGLEPEVPVVLVVGGSQGAQRLNDVLLDSLAALLPRCAIIHQTGGAHFTAVRERADFILRGNAHAERYKPFPYLNETALKMSAGVATLIVTRAGSMLFEIAAWGLPAIIVPIPERVSHDQRTNAFTYARSGAAEVIEEENLSPSVFVSEIERLLADERTLTLMREAARAFGHPEAARTIARELLNICLAHES